MASPKKVRDTSANNVNGRNAYWTNNVVFDLGTGGNYLTFTEGTGTLAVVPEPATLGMLTIAGLAGLAASRRRSRA